MVQTPMRGNLTIGVSKARVLAALLASAGLVCAAAACVGLAEGQKTGETGTRAVPAPDVPLDAEEIRALVARVIENQHRNDEELNSYERIESMVTRGGKNGEDIKIARVLSTGISLERIELEHNGKAIDPAEIADAWQRAEHAIAVENRPGDPHLKSSYEKFEKKKRERYDMVEAIGKAFRFHWVGRVVKGDRVLVELTFDPDPSFKSSAIYGLVYPHMRGTAWIDEKTGQTFRIEASLTDDVEFAEGLIAKVYRGGHATLEQEEVAPGTWLPTHFTWDYEGRKFLVSSLDGHGRMDASDYRRMGSPEEALAMMRHDHPRNNDKPNDKP